MGKYEFRKKIQFINFNPFCLEHIYDLIDETLDVIENSFIEKYSLKKQVIILPDISIELNNNELDVIINLDFTLSPLNKKVKSESTLAEEFVNEFYKNLREKLEERGCAGISQEN